MEKSKKSISRRAERII
ncbi:MAG TPA: hypothetical protein LFW20_00800 [Rickettsia endosymbiont of Omalisus fontisbellaquei]|nr:hypothetical protein [Rickettsia endosymbiont of Omalisus fontisbellaquei]